MSAADVLVQDFTPESGVFFLGMKALNVRSVAAARGSRDRVLPVVGRHLYRETGARTCWAGGSIDPSRTRLNYSLLPDMPMSSSAMVAMALDAAADHGIDWSRLRKDQIVGVEQVVSLPPGFNGDSRAFFMDTLAWVRFTFPRPVTIIAAVVHRDEIAEHMHIVLLPLTRPGSMNGHQVLGFKGVYAKRVSSFHQQVGQKHGLGKPRRKANLTYQERQQVAERVLAKMLADGAAWADNPPAVAAMRKMLTADPVPMAQALGLMQVAVAGNVDKTAYAVAGQVEADAAGVSTAYLCYAVEPDVVPGGVWVLTDEVLAGEALTLRSWQLTATCVAGPAPLPADPTPTPATPAPIHRVLGYPTGPRADDDGDAGGGSGGGDEGDDDNLVRERDDLIPSAYWHDDLGQFILPRTDTRRAIVGAAAEINEAMP
jgi:hypothetical protein